MSTSCRIISISLPHPTLLQPLQFVVLANLSHLSYSLANVEREQTSWVVLQKRKSTIEHFDDMIGNGVLTENVRCADDGGEEILGWIDKVFILV